MQDPRQQLCANHVLDIRSAGSDDVRCIDSWGVFREIGFETVGEDVLGYGDCDGAAEGVEEYCDGVAGWHVFRGKDDLHGYEGDCGGLVEWVG